MIAFIDEYADRFSVEFTCATLNSQRQGGLHHLSRVPQCEIHYNQRQEPA